MGNGSVRHDRRRRLKLVKGAIGRGKNIVRAPRHEHKRAIRLAVDVKVVAIASVPIPMPDEHFGGPEGEKAVEINRGGEGI